MKRAAVLLATLFMAFLLSGFNCNHNWIPPTCTEPQTCTKCGETFLYKSGHQWSFNEDNSLKCSICGELQTLFRKGPLLYFHNTEYNTVTICGCTSVSPEKIKIPETLDGYTVTEIYPYTFEDQTTASQVILPDTIKVIGEGAFYGMTSLTQVNLPEGVEYIGIQAFGGCDKLKSIKLPDSLIFIEGNPFVLSPTSISVSRSSNGYALIDEVLFEKITKKVVAYPHYQFEFSYEIPYGIQNIGVAAFYDARFLKSIVIPDTVTIIDTNAFAWCYSLKELEIPNSVIAIGSYAFSNCKNLETILIPSSVTIIGNDILKNVDGVIVIVEEGSYAEQYCIANGIQCAYEHPDSWLTQ